MTASRARPGSTNMRGTAIGTSKKSFGSISVTSAWCCSANAIRCPASPPPAITTRRKLSAELVHVDDGPLMRALADHPVAHHRPNAELHTPLHTVSDFGAELHSGAHGSRLAVVDVHVRAHGVLPR